MLKQFRVKTAGNTVDYITKGKPEWATTEGAEHFHENTMKNRRSVENRFKKKFW